MSKKEQYIQPKIYLEEYVALCASKMVSGRMGKFEISEDDYSRIGELFVKHNKCDFNINPGDSNSKK